MRKKFLLGTSAGLLIAALAAPAHAGAAPQSARAISPSDAATELSRVTMDDIAAGFRACGVGAQFDISVDAAPREDTLIVNRGAWVPIGGKTLSQAKMRRGIDCAEQAFQSAMERASASPQVSGGDRAISVDVVLTGGVEALSAPADQSSSDGSVLAKALEGVTDRARPKRNTYEGGGFLGRAGCTAGFVAKDDDGRMGLLTADHCRSTSSYSPAGTNKFAFEYIDMETAEEGETDAQFGRTRVAKGLPEKQRKKFRKWRLTNAVRTNKGKRSVVEINNAGNSESGDIVCHFGWGSKAKSCGEVRTTDSTVYYASLDRTYTGVMKVYPVEGAAKPLRCVPGDSGGPWFNGQAAVGLHSGAVRHDDGTPMYCLVSQIEEVEMDLGVEVVTWMPPVAGPIRNP